VRFAFIAEVADEQRLLPAGVRFPIDFMRRMLDVSRQGYHAWLTRPPSARDQEDAGLAGRIRELHADRHKNRAGIGRITWDLAEDGIRVSERRVRRLARADGLKCVHPGPSARTTIRGSAARSGLVDLVERDFTAPAPDQLWVGDITYTWTLSGFSYLATLIDMYSSKVVGWAVADHMRAELVPGALSNAPAARDPGIGELIIHHDRGAQYTSNEYRDRLFAAGIIPSVGHTGICYDNAAAESFNATIKKELIHLHVWRDADHVRTAVFDYIERYYNRVRKQRGLRRLSPAGYETEFDKRKEYAA
jgi:putative transposase